MISLRQLRSNHPEKFMALAILTGIFLFSRIMLFCIGIRFETWGNRLIMHFIHPSILTSGLFESIYHLHAQPPLFNLFIGLVLKVFPTSYTTAFHSCYLACGLATTWTLYLLMVRTGVRSRLASIMTALFMLSPSTILFENVLLYTYPVITLLCLAGFSMFSFLDRGRFRDGLLFFILLMVIVLTRSLYHLVWMFAALGIMITFKRSLWKTTLKAAFIPLIIVVSLYAKNLVLFGTFSSSTWMGMSFCKITTLLLPEQQRLDLIGEGKLSELAMLPSYRGLWYYRDRIDIPSFEKTGISVLDLEHYESGGLNYNNLSYISLSNQYMKDSLYVLLHFPTTFMKGLLSSFKIYFFPASDWFSMLDETNKNRKILKPFIRPFNTFVYGQLFNGDDSSFSQDYTWTQYAQPAGKVGVLLVVWVLVSFVSGTWYAAGILRKKNSDMARAGAMVFMLMTILYVTVIGNCLEVGENHRFRCNIDPFLLVFLGLFLQDIAAKFKTPDTKAVNAIRHSKSRGNR